MTEGGLPVLGYALEAQSKVKVDRANELKQHEERLLRELDALAQNGILRVEPTCDPRWLAIARTHIEEAFMALNKAIFKPQRIALPEDVEQPTAAYVSRLATPENTGPPSD